MYIIRNFSFSYPFSGTKIALQGTITINRGDCILLTGASGSGKSTLLLALKGIIPHVIHGTMSGKILFNTQNINTLSEQDLLSIGYLQQNPDHQLVCPDVFSELALGLENQQLSPEVIRTKITHYLDLFALNHLAHRQVATLSGGEKQIINLLAILLLEPEVLLLDEPTAFLDGKTAYQLINILKTYIHNKTVIIIEHNLQYLHNFVNRIIDITHDGIIREHATIGSLNSTNSQQLRQCSKLSNKSEPPLLNIHNLQFSYANSVPLFKCLNLTIYPKQIIGIIGKNGSGKSTLLKLIAKLMKYTTGQILWQGQEISQINKYTYWRNVSLVWQNPENHFLKYQVKDELINQPELLKQINLAPQAITNPFNLSEGQKRRLSLAIMLHDATKLCLLDEPTFGQDSANKHILARLISDLTSHGNSFIIVSHDIEFLQSLTNDIYILEHGQLQHDK